MTVSALSVMKIASTNTVKRQNSSSFVSRSALLGYAISTLVLFPQVNTVSGHQADSN